MLAVAVSARAPTADPRIEVTLSPGLRTSPLPVTPAGVADRWRHIGQCQKPPWRNALQVEKMLRIAHKRIGEPKSRTGMPGSEATGWGRPRLRVGGERFGPRRFSGKDADEATAKRGTHFSRPHRQAAA